MRTLRSWKFVAHMLTISLVGGVAEAGNTGKIAGVIRDKQTREVVVGANIMVRGTRLGTSSDVEGRYFILQVPPGVYDVEASGVGYHPLRIKDVKVQIDLTTTLEVQLESRLIEAPTVEVTAERKLVQKDVTSTRRTVTRENMLGTPSVETTDDIFKLQGGAFISSAPQSFQLPTGASLQVRDESLKDIHVRGGRGGELLYMVDGMPVTHPIYGGRSVLELNVSDVEQVELLTGGFNAEYGQAQSGVVNITTRSGGEHFAGGVEYKTDKLGFLGESYDTDYSSLYLGGPDPITGTLLPSIGISIPGAVRYFLSANATITNTPYNNQRTREEVSVLGIPFTEKQDNTGSFNAKLNWDITGTHRLTASYQGSWKRWSGFDWAWKYYPDHTAGYQRTTNNMLLQFNHVLSNATYYNLNLGYLRVAYRGSLFGATPADFWRITPSSTGADSIYTTILAPQVDPTNKFLDSLGYESIWRDDLTHTLTFKADITSQIHPEHLLKAGVEVQYNDISYVDIQDGGTKLSNYGEYLYHGAAPYPAPPGPYQEFGLTRWVFGVTPFIGSFYLQDKFELEFLILNAGIRLDWYTVGKEVFADDWKSMWETATGLTADWKKLNYQISPRFGISFPISERTVLFFSYGHFIQMPEIQSFYRDPYSGGLTGNPGLDYEQTILYEFGFTHLLLESWVVDLKSYAKDISRQVETTPLQAAGGLPVALFDNKGYSRTRGLEFTVTKAGGDLVAGSLTYTVQWANGYSSSAFEEYIRSLNDFPNPIRERRLGWDVRHEVIFQATVGTGPGIYPDLFGLTLPDNWSITLLFRFTTGQPYTPYTLDPAEAQVKENSETGPSMSTTDVKLVKGFDVAGLRLSILLEIFNILDQNNVQIYYGFNNYTGQPYRYGDTVPPSNQYYDWNSMHRLRDPRQFSTGRTARLGIRLDW